MALNGETIQACIQSSVSIPTYVAHIIYFQFRLQQTHDNASTKYECFSSFIYSCNI